MNHIDFFQKLKSGDLPNVLLFHGDEEYVKEQAFSELKKGIVPQCGELNLNYFDSGTADEIIASCDVAPFMADKRMVVCRFIPKEKDAKKLLDYLANIPDFTIFVFYIHGKADVKTAVVKQLKTDGFEVLFDYFDEGEAVKWVMQNALKMGCTISAADAKYMTDLVGRDMLSIKNELIKLCDYCREGGVITKSIIANIVIKNLEFQLYNTYSYFTNGKMQDGFRSLESILNGKDKDSESMGIAGYFLSCLKAALSAYDLIKRNASQQEMERVTGKKGWALKELCKTAKKFTRQQLLEGITAFANVARTRIVLGQSSYNALCDSIIKTFSHIK